MYEKAIGQPGVWIISSQQWPRALLRAELIERGYDAIGFRALDEALIALARAIREPPDAVILDLADQQVTRSQLTGLSQARIPTILLGGALDLEDPQLSGFAWAGILRRPFMLREVTALVERIAAPAG